MIESFTGEYRFLSNFYMSDIIINGKTFKSVEHFYQSQKATNKNDFEEIVSSPTPGKAKRLGGKIDVKSNWDNIKVNVMMLGLTTKFSSTIELQKKLLATHPIPLIEGNSWGDTFWGMDISTQEGSNILGVLLMLIRAETLIREMRMTALL